MPAVVVVTRVVGVCRRTVVGVAAPTDVVAWTSVLTRGSPPPLEQAAAITTKAVVASMTNGRRNPADRTTGAYASGLETTSGDCPEPTGWM